MRLISRASGVSETKTTEKKGDFDAENHRRKTNKLSQV